MSGSFPAGFNNTPVTKYLIVATFALPIIASLTTTKYIYYLNFTPFLSEYHQLWRLLTYQLAFVNESEVLVAAVLLYQFRPLERLYSSYKYLSIILVLWLYNLILTTLWMSLKFYTGITWFNEVSSGPTAVIFGLLFQFKEFIPVIYKFELVNSTSKLVLTDQFFIYILSFQLLVSQGWKSILSGIFGYLISDLVIRLILPGKNWRLVLLKQLFQKSSVTGTGDNDNTADITSDGAGASATADDDDDEATETRPLSTQFLDTFRRS